ncbi:hypothetical protein Q4F19_01675 [Sphingomonas sp. BIUV-7]|uniref:Uncharacterized protein n=1 Tax=Sphingomonas natans TaxID=3063330 RepID=A0ABT8Y437_9SPHN|nr:hypothetical protein [Sphingomonas sp. BIUV-7]MDO6413080.1 hypothetical protein [Sphingomonas sp. BIUV-7]
MIGTEMAAVSNSQAEKDQLAAAVGFALSEWAEVEIVLTFILISVLDTGTEPHVEGIVACELLPEGQRMLHAGMGRLVAFDARLDFVSAVIEESSLADWIKGLWRGIASRLTKKYKSRHQIAHFIICDEEGRDGRVRSVVDPFPTSITSIGGKRLSLSDVTTKLHNFRELKEALQWFGLAVEIDRKRQGGLLPPDPPLIARARQGASI